MTEEITLKPTAVKFTRYKPGQAPAAPSVTIIGSMAPSDMELASLTTKAKRLRAELLTWVKSGAKMVPRQIRAQRLATCAACEYFDPKGNWGLGQCRAPGCGCSKIKAALASSVCPKGKWAS